MKVLVVGAGVVGTVYGAHLAAAGNTVSVLSHGPRTEEVAAGGLCARDATGGGSADAETAVVPDASGIYDIVLVTVRRDQLASACAGLTGLAGKPAVLFLGNNPAGRAAIPGGMPGEVYLGFPGVGGVMTGGTAEYVRIRQQPTALQETSDARLAAFESALTGRGFPVQRIADMDGWLAYHAAFVACICAALYRRGTDPVRLAADRATLTLMCRAITEAFAALRADGTAGLPRNLAVLHSPLLRVVAVRYWARTMRSPMGELCFAAHARHAEPEMRALGHDVEVRITGSPALTELLRP
jgi:2-dehydropantoate 2-reductase